MYVVKSFQMEFVNVWYAICKWNVFLDNHNVTKHNLARWFHIDRSNTQIAMTYQYSIHHDKTV